MEHRSGPGIPPSTPLFLLLAALSLCALLFTPAVSFSDEAKSLEKQAQNALRQGQRQMFNGKIDKAFEHLAEARTAIDGLISADPGNSRLKSLENKYKKLEKDLERRAEKPAPKASPATAEGEKGGKGNRLPGGLVRRLKGLDDSFRRLEELFEQAAREPTDARIEFIGTTLSAAGDEMAHILKYYGDHVGHPEVAARREKLDAYRARLEETTSAQTAKADAEAAETRDLTQVAEALGDRLRKLHDAHYASFEGIYGRSLLDRYAPEAAEKALARIEGLEKGAIPELRPVMEEIADRFGDSAMAVNNALHAIDFPASERFGNRFEELRESIGNVAESRQATAEWIAGQARSQGDAVGLSTHQAMLRIAHRLDPDNAAVAELLQETEAKVAAAGDSLEGIFFSKTPIDPDDPRNLATRFTAGDPIYCLIRSRKPFQEIFGKDWVRIEAAIDGKKIHTQFVKLHNPSDRAGKTLRFEIAPTPENMTAYADPDIEYGTSKPNLRQGPQEMTHHLAGLGPGEHTVTMALRYAGDTYAEGSFTIRGDDFGRYADLNEKVARAMTASVTLPRAKMENPGLEKQMKALLKKAGWDPIHRLNIVDKDWWIDRTSGGNSPVKSRHIAAAVLSRDEGGYFYKKVTFHQDRLITGGYGDLYISHTGGLIEIPKENIDK